MTVFVVQRVGRADARRPLQPGRVALVGLVAVDAGVHQPARDVRAGVPATGRPGIVIEDSALVTSDRSRP